MTSRTLLRLFFLASAALRGPNALAIDLRLDVATDNNNGNDTDWFGSLQLVNLNFRSVNGHDIEQGGATHQSTIQAAGNTLGVYYDTFHSDYSSTETPAAEAAKIQSWFHGMFGSNETSAWLALNEADGSTWDGASGDAYRTWLVQTMSALNSDGYQHIVLFAPQSLASKTYASTWQGIAQYAYIGAEMFIDGQTAVNDNYSVSTLQSQYQTWYNAWTSTSNGAGLSASKLLCDEHFSVNLYDPSHYWGANGVSGGTWQTVIEARDVAIHNIPFGGFIGYAWDKDAQATGGTATDLAAQISYERAYASTLVTQTEIPAWTGNDGSGSWADYLNWTGGLPSTVSAPFPLLAASNPNLPKQDTANFFNAPAYTVITLDGPQSITHLAFSGSYSYTITPGSGGSLTLSGTGASVSVTSGSHVIAAPLVLASSTAVTVTHAADILTVSGSISGACGLSLNGAGTLKLTASNSYRGGTTINGGLLTAGAAGALSASSAMTVGAPSGSGTLDASGFANTIASLTMSGSGWLNLGLGKTLTSTGVAALGGTLHVAGLGTLGNYRLLAYASRTGTFAAATGIGSSYGLLYNTNGTELDALHKAQVGVLTVTAASPTVITGGATNLTVNVTNPAPSQSDALVLTASAGGTGYGLSTTGSLVAAGSGSFTIASGFNSALFAAGSYTGTVMVTGSNGALGGLALNSGGTAAVTINVLDHAAGGAAVTAGNGFLAHAGATGLSAAVSLSNAAGTRSDLQVNSVPTISSGTLSGGPAAPYYVSAGAAVTYAATFNAGDMPGVLSNSVSFANIGDNQSLPGASPPGSLSVSITGNVYSGKAQWSATGGGAWQASGNWTDTAGGGPSGAPGVLGYAGDTATFGNAIGGTSAVITLDVPATVSAVTFSNTAAGGYTLSGGGSNTLTLNNSGSGATIAVTSGSQVIDAPIILADNLVVSGSGALAFSASSNITESGGHRSLTMNGAAGTLTLSGSDNYTGGTSVTTGTLIATNADAIPTGTNLIVGDANAFAAVAPEPAGSSSAAPVPEPSTLALVSVAFCGAAVYQRIRSQRKKR